MSTWDQLNEWLATAIFASLTWVFGVISPGLSPSADWATPEANQGNFIVGWAQQVDQPPIEQVGEGAGDDVETLDEGTPPAEDQQPVDQISQDAGAVPVAQDDDVELLDQGAPQPTTGQPVETVYVAPVADSDTAYVAPEPAVASGPVLPEGFGTGRVQAVAGRSGTPPGLADCHVGAVTGRAYVGIDCGEDEANSFVGHAPSLQDFPFVIEAEFPFEGDEAFFSDDFPFGDDAELTVAAGRGDTDETDVVVSPARNPRDDEVAAPVIETSGESTVQYAQRARDRDPRPRVEDRGSKRNKDSGKDSQRGGNGNADGAGTGTESSNSDDRKNNEQDDQVNADSKEKPAKDKKVKKDKKKRAERKEQRTRSRDRG